ncbi:YhcN/YlaJ family sporulation lipoprotein [Bacillus aquiflavi]|uniref:YhcN/YlaJ family sporulation lipoprotein n=1 Tax=Bacillus aquiflavi TaxID=2672567 RepID=A0A6B3VZ44_9BACI|nr:YhcN/YlaJ family sporulation lipoprotein [Bacillus aquiflavi]MBA4537926.1 YhcN/YlaJ family sporulation lipoprotein [Bacillus aquiflavi]NEY82182.1 YhcN/YlaJ family sporulation lipoprotein [Bacillus aquiflavi]UAC49258.1 YhcN/YlaJ family sporulation lipoprotein [Bacillus aquiflavi]
MKNFLLILLSVIMLASCGFQQNTTEKKQTSQNNNLTRVKNSTIEHVDRKTGQDISKHLVQLASSIPNVNDATAVVLGKYAIVGIDVNENIERSEVGSIKYSVAESLKNDPYGARAIIIADPDMNARLNEIAEDINDGKPIQGILNELADITGRLIPEVPADVIEPKPKNAPEEPKKKLNRQEQQQLEKEQQDQSNNYKD